MGYGASALCDLCNKSFAVLYAYTLACFLDHEHDPCTIKLHVKILLVDDHS